MANSMTGVPDIDRSIILTMYDIEDINNLYNSSRYFQDIIDDPIFSSELSMNFGYNPDDNFNVPRVASSKRCIEIYSAQECADYAIENYDLDSLNDVIILDFDVNDLNYLKLFVGAIETENLEILDYLINNSNFIEEASEKEKRDIIVSSIETLNLEIISLIFSYIPSDKFPYGIAVAAIRSRSPEIFDMVTKKMKRKIDFRQNPYYQYLAARTGDYVFLMHVLNQIPDNLINPNSILEGAIESNSISMVTNVIKLIPKGYIFNYDMLEKKAVKTKNIDIIKKIMSIAPYDHEWQTDEFFAYGNDNDQEYISKLFQNY
jgi:hypothetical protein